MTYANKVQIKKSDELRINKTSGAGREFYRFSETGVSFQKDCKYKQNEKFDFDFMIVKIMML